MTTMTTSNWSNSDQHPATIFGCSFLSHLEANSHVTGYTQPNSKNKHDRNQGSKDSSDSARRIRSGERRARSSSRHGNNKQDTECLLSPLPRAVLHHIEPPALCKRFL